MTLEEYLKENDITGTTFAALIGKHKVYIHRVLQKGVIPNKEDMQKIIKATNGKVQPNDFYAT